MDISAGLKWNIDLMRKLHEKNHQSSYYMCSIQKWLSLCMKHPVVVKTFLSERQMLSKVTSSSKNNECPYQSFYLYPCGTWEGFYWTSHRLVMPEDKSILHHLGTISAPNLVSVHQTVDILVGAQVAVEETNKQSKTATPRAMLLSISKSISVLMRDKNTGPKQSDEHVSSKGKSILQQLQSALSKTTRFEPM